MDAPVTYSLKMALIGADLTVTELYGEFLLTV